ncbi:MAG: hypothetical protein QM758_19015 [Armatimonas sp.]
MNAAAILYRLCVGALLVGAASCAPPVDKSLGEPIHLSSPTKASMFPVNVPSTLPAPPPPQFPEPGISGQDIGFADPSSLIFWAICGTRMPNSPFAPTHSEVTGSGPR